MNPSNKNLRCGSWLYSTIRDFEGRRLIAYKDFAKGVWTIGYGSTRNVKSGLVIDKAQAEQRLLNDVAIAWEGVMLLVMQPIEQYAAEALADFVYNFGLLKLKSSSLLHKLNDGQDYLPEFAKWNHAVVGGKMVEVSGLTRRRKAEMEHILCKGIYKRNLPNK